MNIGTVTPTAAGELLGHIAIMNFDARIGFRPVASSNERSPKFEVMALNVARRWVRIGALWEKEARATGEIYLAGHIDDPALAAKLFIAAFRHGDGAYSLAWSRSNPQGRPGDGAGTGEVDDELADEVAPGARSAPAPATPAAANDPFA